LCKRLTILMRFRDQRERVRITARRQVEKITESSLRPEQVQKVVEIMC
jgi:hypothetical protein